MAMSFGLMIDGMFIVPSAMFSAYSIRVASRLAVCLVHVDEVRLELADQLAQRVPVVPVRAEVLVLVLNSLRVDPLEQRGLRRVRLVP